MEKEQKQTPRKTAARRDEITIPVIEEEVVTGARPVKTGSVSVEKHLEREKRKIEASVLRERVEVRHVPVNRPVNEVPAIRREGDTVIVPVVEEEVVVSKRLVLKEEIHLIRRRAKERVARDVEVKRERAEVRRLDASGRIVDSFPRRTARDS